MKLKLLLKMFEVLHQDLKSIYYILLSMTFSGDKRENKNNQAISDFNSSFVYAKADIEQEIANENKGKKE